jgi:hypothetical protein
MAEVTPQNPAPAIVGCMDRQATNYDPSATIPCEGSGAGCCIYVQSNNVGCMDRLASNYDINADTPCDGCCLYVDEEVYVPTFNLVQVVVPETNILGCTDPLATNYNSSVTIPCEDCCIYDTQVSIVGCTDPLATNYDPSATFSCEDCCFYDLQVSVVGCTDPTATNYDPTATTSCDDCCLYSPPDIIGCTDPTATNYDPTATTSCDGCCLFEVEPCPTLRDGSITLLTEQIGSVTTTYLNVPERCCSNTSLESTIPGDWTWDGVRCVLEDETNECKIDTVITLSETPIDVRGLECLENTVTISAWIYFTEPGDLCTGTGAGNPSTGGAAGSPRGTQRHWLGTHPTISELYSNPPETTEEIALFSQNTWPQTTFGNVGIGTTPQEHSGPTPIIPEDKCCYDTDNPIEGRLIILDSNNQKITTNVTYVDTFLSQVTTINTNSNVGVGFNKWVKLTTTVSTTNLTPFSVAAEFPKGLFHCCEYDIFFDDLEVGCLQPGIRDIYNTEECPGFNIRHVIDNKKSWVYNPGTSQMSDDVNDNIIRKQGELGMNIDQSNPLIIDGGHGAINRVFAPSLDAELPFRDTDYFGKHGVIERHSKLVLNSKEVILQFNMCPDDDCLINPFYLIDDYGQYILDDDGGRIIVGSTPFPNLIQLETFKKTFQGFWVQFMEQFIPATTIFVSGEKWCNSRICGEKIVNDYVLDACTDDGILSPPPINQNVVVPPNPNPTIFNSQPIPISGGLDNPVSTAEEGETGSSSSSNVGPIVVGNYQIYALPNLLPYLGDTIVREIPIT